MKETYWTCTQNEHKRESQIRLICSVEENIQKLNELDFSPAFSFPRPGSRIYNAVFVLFQWLWLPSLALHRTAIEFTKQTA